MRGFALLAALAVVVILVGIAGSQSDSASDPSLAATVPPVQGPTDSDLRVEARMLVEQSLRDPESAKFGDLFVVRRPDTLAVCGDVNAKNGFGGYTGATSFIMLNGHLRMHSEANAASFVKLWNRLCAA